MLNTRIFISYSHTDEPLLDELKLHLATLQREGLVDTWTPRRILPGDEWEAKIDGQLEDARIVLLLVSAAFVASKYCYEIEMERALERHLTGAARVIPVILRPCDWRPTKFGKLAALPQGGKPVIKWEPRDDAWLDVVRGLRRVLEEGGGGLARSPGPIPHNLPFPSLGGLFKGRDEERAELSPGDAVVITARPQTIHGLGGMGKTRLAVEFAWRNLERYCAALFVVATSPERLRAELAALVDPLSLELELLSGAQEEAMEAVLHWLETHLGWLLIFDNVDTEDAAGEVERLLPKLTAGHVLITSRLASWSGGIRRTAIDTISPPEAEAFLLERTGRDNAGGARELAAVLDGLPLALEQAAAYMLKRRRSFARYLAEWHARRERVLAWHDERLMKYPASVATTWETTFDLLSTAARTVLRLAAHLAPEPIAVAMFEKGAEIVEEAHSVLGSEEDEKLDLADVLAELADFSMITFEDETFTAHRLVQAVTRSRIEEGGEEAWVVWTLRLVEGYAPDNPIDVRTWSVWEPLRAHVGRVLEHGGKVGNPEPAAGLMHQLAVLLWSKALNAEAEPLIRKALKISEASLGPCHEAVASHCGVLALILEATNRLAEAEPLYRRALEIDEERYGAQHPKVALRLNNLAQLLKAMNRLLEAEPLMRRTLEIDKASFEAENPNVAIHLNNLAALLKAMNRLEEAEPLMRRALEIDEENYGTQQHPNVAIRMNNLAQLLKATNRLLEAEPLVRGALEIFTRSLGLEHPWTQKAQANLDAILGELP